jgi:hypothetical protein
MPVQHFVFCSKIQTLGQSNKSHSSGSVVLGLTKLHQDCPSPTNSLFSAIASLELPQFPAQQPAIGPQHTLGSKSAGSKCFQVGSFSNFITF